MGKYRFPEYSAEKYVSTTEHVVEELFPNTSASEAKVLMVLVSEIHGHGNQRTVISYRLLADRCNVTTDTVKTAIDGLLDKGYIRRVSDYMHPQGCGYELAF